MDTTDMTHRILREIQGTLGEVQATLGDHTARFNAVDGRLRGIAEFLNAQGADIERISLKNDRLGQRIEHLDARLRALENGAGG